MSTSPNIEAPVDVRVRTRVLLADDNALIRSTLARLVRAERDLLLVGTAVDGMRAVELAEREQPHVVVLDLSMPGVHGLTAAEQIRHKSPSSRVLVLSFHVQESIVTAAFAAGVHGYLTKDVSSGDVLDGIRHTHAGQMVVSDRVRSVLGPQT